MSLHAARCVRNKWNRERHGRRNVTTFAPGFLVGHDRAVFVSHNASRRRYRKLDTWRWIRMAVGQTIEDGQRKHGSHGKHARLGAVMQRNSCPGRYSAVKVAAPSRQGHAQQFRFQIRQLITIALAQLVHNTTNVSQGRRALMVARASQQHALHGSASWQHVLHGSTCFMAARASWQHTLACTANINTCSPPSHACTARMVVHA